MRKLSVRKTLPIAAVALFVILSFATHRQQHVIDLPGWERISKHEIVWGEEPVDIGTPADILLLAFNLPAIVALLPLLPLTYWVDSEIVLRTAWGLSTIAQWFLIGCYWDTRRRLLPAWTPGTHVLLYKTMFGTMIAVGSVAAGLGIFGEASGHHNRWGVVLDASFVFWGIIFIWIALRWRSSSSWLREQFSSLDLT